MKKAFTLTFICFSFFARTQTIKLENSSFEKVDSIVNRLMFSDPISGKMRDTFLFLGVKNIHDWADCGAKGETPPDILPNSDYGINWAAQDGAYYIGMVTRDNSTWEAIGQKIQPQLLADSCYEMTAWLMSSWKYNSFSRKTGKPVNYDKPARLRIWGGSKICDSKELLFTSDPIQNRAWMPYSFVFKAHTNIIFIKFESYYTEGSEVYNGNLLIDNFSDIKPCDCVKLHNK